MRRVGPRCRRSHHVFDVARIAFEQKSFSSPSRFKIEKNFLPRAAFRGIRQSVPRRLRVSAATAALLIICTTVAYAQMLAPPKLAVSADEQPPAKKNSAPVVTTEKPEVVVKEKPPAITKEPQVVTKEPQPTRKEPEVVTKEPQVAKKEKEPVAVKETSSIVARRKPEATGKSDPQIITKEKKTKTTPISEPIRPIAHYSFKTPEGNRESVQVITHYYPGQISGPLATTDKHFDPKLMRAASIAEERAHAHSRSMCWHYVKEALLASGVIETRPKSELARDAANDLVTNYGFKKLSVRDPFAAPIGSVLVYGTSRSVGHVEIRTKDGFVSDFRSPTPSKRPLIGVYAKL